VAQLIFLGTAAAVPDPHHENSLIALRASEGAILIDCGGSPTLRLAEAGIELDEVSDIILTHFHPDHVGGLPLLLMNMWLLGREGALRIYGLHHCLERVEHMMGFYQWEDWPDFFPVAFHRLPEREMVTVLERPEVRILSSPVRHVVPTIGLRIEIGRGAHIISYSCDTEPCPAFVRLAKGSHIVIHEATGESPGHSTAAQAGQVAAEAGAEQLFLIHYPTGVSQADSPVDQARQMFSGEVHLAEDFMTLDL